MKPHGLSRALLLAVITVGIALSGCASRLQPSPQQRQIAVDEAHARLGERWPMIARSIFVTFAGDSPFEPKATPADGTVVYSGFPEASVSGVAAAIAADGYLITDQHILRPHMWVLGNINGHMQFRRARVVHARAYEQFGDEFALLHIDARDLPHFEMGAVTPALDEVIAVGSHRHELLDIEPIWGRLTAPARPPSPDHVAVLRSDLPLSPGDSGGPLLTPSGQLIAVNNSSIMPWFTLKVTALSGAPDPLMIRRLIEADRTREDTSAPPPP